MSNFPKNSPATLSFGMDGMNCKYFGQYTHTNNRVRKSQMFDQTKWRKKSFVHLLEIISVPEINGTNSAVSYKFQGWYVRHSAERYARAVQSHGPLGRTGGRRGCRICTWNKLLLTICVGPTGCECVRQNINRAECARTATVRINLYVALITGVP